MSITWLVLTALSLAGAPEREERSFSGSGSVDGGNVSDDGSLVSFVSNGTARVISLDTWQEHTVDSCTVTAATPVPVGATSEIWVGCSDGTLQIHGFVGGELTRLTDSDGEDIEIEASTSQADVLAMHATDAVVYAITEGTVSSLVTFDPTAEVPSAVNTATFNWQGFRASTIGPNFVHVAHDQAQVSSIQLPGSAPLASTSALSLVAVDDLAPTSVLAGQPLLVETGRGIAPYSVTNRGHLGIVLSDTSVQAVGVSTVSGDEWALVAYESAAEVIPMTTGQLSGATEPTATFSVEHRYNDIVVTPDGYAFGGATDGTIQVMSDRPLVVLDDTDLGAVSEGDTGSFAFTSDRAGSWSAQVGGSSTGGGTELASGDIGAGGSGLVEYTVSSDWPEGDNDLYVIVTDESGRTGHGWASVSVDAAPGKVSVGSVSFGDQELSLTFTALDAEDIASYMVYVSDEAFSAEDHPSGGPSFEVDEPEFSAPLQVSSFSAGEAVEVEISPLVNGTTYYLAVRATDELGKEGPMSTVVTGRPRDTLTASEAAGDPGGMQCASIGATGAGWLSGLGLVVLGLRRRRRIQAGLVGMALAGLMVGLALPGVALADDEDEADETGPPVMSEGYQEAMEQEDRRTGDLTPAWGNAELRFGYWTAQEESFESVFGGPASSQLQFEIGPQLFRVVEIDVGGGLVLRNGQTIAVDDGAASGEETRLMIVPLSLSVTPRLHIFDEQPLVPYASFGGDWWLWREREGGADDTGKVVRSGSHFGWHWEVGVNILLDTFDRRRASLLEAQAGINDSWITLGYRRQTDLSDVGFDFGGGVLHAGLKLDF